MFSRDQSRALAQRGRAVSEPDHWQEIRHARKMRRKLERLPDMRVERRRLTWTTDAERRAALKEWHLELAKCRELRAPGLRLASVMGDVFHSGTGACWKSQETFAAELGCKERRITEGRGELEVRGFLHKEWGREPTGRTKRKVLLFYPALPVPERADCAPSLASIGKADCTPSVNGGRRVRPVETEEGRTVGLSLRADCQPTILDVSETQGFPRESLSSLPGAHLTRATPPHHHLRGAFRDCYRRILDDEPSATPQHFACFDLGSRWADDLDSKERWPLTGKPQ